MLIDVRFLPTRSATWGTRRGMIAALVGLLGTVLFGSPAIGQATSKQIPSYNVARTSAPISIDGKLDELDWSQATAVGDFQFPWWTAGAKEQTVAKLLWDDEFLYVSYRCTDSHLWAEHTERDSNVYEDDCVEVFTAPNPSRPNDYFNIEMNVNGAFLDQHHPDGPGKPVDEEWNAEGVRIAVEVDGTLNQDSDEDRFWCLEAAIPFSNFAGVAAHTPPHDGDVWRLNLNRLGGKTNSQFSQWSASDTQRPQFHAPNSFGRVVFSVQSSDDASSSSTPALQVGAAVVDVTPDQLPVVVNGGFLSKSADKVKTRVNARAIVLRQGDDQIAMVVVDSCMIPQFLVDDVKQRAAQRTRLRPDRIMISATHTHTAPSAFAALGTPADLSYVPVLRERIVEALVAAEASLQPALYGWGTAEAAEFTALRRWVLRPDRKAMDPFGNATVRANMHAGKNLDDVTGQSGPEDPELSMIAFQSTQGDPIAVLANFSMHYFGDQPISADYFGLFCDGLENHMGRDRNDGNTAKQKRGVGLLSHGCSGDIWRRDYVNWTGKDQATIEGYTQGLLKIATKIYDSIEYSGEGGLSMAQTRLPMRYRVPDQQRLEWAQRIVDGIEGDLPSDRTEVYAREQVLLHQMQSTEVVVQAIRIGDIAIATTPNETYALTGLKIKARSPLHQTMVIELANGADGYIPPPEQHQLGGYNTWAARSAGLETQAEPRIAAAALTLLEQVTGMPRRHHRQTVGPSTKAILDRQPIAYWRLDEMEASAAVDSSPNHRDGIYEPGVLFFLEGPDQEGFTPEGEINRCAHFAGGRMRSRLESLGDTYTVLMSFWNGMPDAARDTTGWLFSRDHPHTTSSRGDHLGIGGTSSKPGCVVFKHGNGKTIVGKTVIQRWTWNRLALVRQGNRVRVYLNDQPEPEIDVEVGSSTTAESCFIGGRSDNDSNFEGRIDEVAVFDRALSFPNGSMLFGREPR